MTRINLKYAFFIGCIIAISLGCKSKRMAPKMEIKERNQEELLKALSDHNIDFNWWSTKADVSIESPYISGSGNARLRIKKDSLVWLLGKKLSIEGVRALITPDEYTVIYRQQNAYQKDHILGLSDIVGFPVLFEDIQHLLVGNVILPEAKMVDTIATKEQSYIIEANVDQFKVEYAVDSYNLSLEAMKLKDNKGRIIDVRYQDYKKVKNFEVAHRLSITFDDNREKSQIILKLKEVEIDVPKKTPFSIPSYYERIY